MLIAIPSRGRADLSLQNTFTSIPDQWKDRVLLVVPSNEKDDYEKIPGMVSRVVPCPMEGIGPTRQWILENFPDTKVLMLDADWYTPKRRSEERRVGKEC